MTQAVAERVSHTPGPWCWRLFGESLALTTVHGGAIIVMDFVRKGMHRAQPRFGIRSAGDKGGIMRNADEINYETHPDARLIAASPELLAACEDALTALYDAMHAGNLSREYHGSVAGKIESAIAKAKGRNQ